MDKIPISVLTLTGPAQGTGLLSYSSKGKQSIRRGGDYSQIADHFFLNIIENY